MNTKYHLFYLVLFTLFSTLIFWGLFYFNIPGRIGFPNTSMETLYANYDGPNYLVISKCGYDKNCIGQNFSSPQPLEYYPAHLPGYPLVIRLINTFLPGPQAMLVSTIVGSVILSLASYYFFRLFLTLKSSFLLAIIMIFFPPRLFLLRQIGAPEVYFLSAILLSLIFFKKNNFLLSASFAAFAQVFKSPGILLFLAYLVYAAYEFLYLKKPFLPLCKKYFVFILVPLTVLVIFYNYYLGTGDFLAYFHSGDNFHLTPLPYLVFISNRSWVNTIWLEDVIFTYGLAMLGIYKLLKKYGITPQVIFLLIFTCATLLVAHRDISRYISPVYPLLILAFGKTLLKKPVFYILIMLVPAVILYSINFAIGNTAPVADWTPYL